MSDMLDRLDEIASEAGADAGGRLASPDVAAKLQAQIAHGVRRRRIVTGALAAAAVVVLGTASVIVPKLIETPVPPAANPTREVVNSSESLLTYSDGSMQVVTSVGERVHVPAPGEGSPRYTGTAVKDACRADPADLAPGWTQEFPEAWQLMSFGRPLSIDKEGHHVLTQGQAVEKGSGYRSTLFAASVDVDPAIAPYVVMSVNVYVLAPDGRIAYVASHLESRPSIQYSGTKGTATYTATATTRGIDSYAECREVTRTLSGEAPENVYYFHIKVFVNDGAGHINPIGAHNSWISVTKEGA